MPPIRKKKTSTAAVPAGMKPYHFHGIEFGPVDDRNEAWADCPSCGHGGKKFSVNAVTGDFSCLACKFNGRHLAFLKWLLDEGGRLTRDTDYELLAADRKLLSGDSLKEWALVKSPLTGEWLLPAYDPEGKLATVYRYGRRWDEKKQQYVMAVMQTPGTKPGLFHVPGPIPDRADTVYQCEGAWDGIALWEVLGQTKPTPGGPAQTANVDASLLATAYVTAVPGAGVFEPTWPRQYAGRRVVLCYDNDYPKPHPTTPGVMIPPAGFSGAKRAAGILVAEEQHKPRELAWLQWSESGYDQGMPNGFDVRDQFSAYEDAGPDLAGRIHSLTGLLDRIQPVPGDWVLGRAPGRGATTELELLPCVNWKTLTTACRKAMHWTEGLETGLAVMLACVTSTQARGDQLWCKIVSPPSTGKSVLAEALSSNQKYVLARSTLTGFHSGFNDGTGQNYSLVGQLNNKTLIIKDGDTLLRAGNRDAILSQARDLYDRVSRSSYGNDKSMEWTALNITFILCGTESLRELDSSELGERFLDCVIVDYVDREVERHITKRTVFSAFRNVDLVADGSSENNDGPEMVLMKQLAGGYVNYLRENAPELIQAVEKPEWAADYVVDLAEFVSHARTRPAKKQDETTQRELSARLGSQLARLAVCLAVVLNKKTLDKDVMEKVRKVALNTARGKTMAVCRDVYENGGAVLHETPGRNLEGIAVQTHMGTDKCRDYVAFLVRLGVLEKRRPPDETTGEEKKTGPVKYWLSPRMHDLWEKVVESGVPVPADDGYNGQS